MKRSTHNLVTPGGFLCAVYGQLRMKDGSVVQFIKTDEICGVKEHKVSLRKF